MNKIKILDSLDWGKIEEITIDQFCWEYDFKPISKAKLCFVKNQGLCVKMWSYEDHPVSVHTENNQFVHKDSCLEFFINAFPEDSDVYVNFEINHLGATFIQAGTSRFDRRFLSDMGIEYPKVGTFSGEDSAGTFWGIKYVIPAELFEKVYGKTGFPQGRIKAGLYKCGDETGRMHFGSWQQIGTEKPDFHRSEFFGELVFD